MEGPLLDLIPELTGVMAAYNLTRLNECVLIHPSGLFAGTSILYKLYWIKILHYKELPSRPFGLSFYGLDALSLS